MRKQQKLEYLHVVLWKRQSESLQRACSVILTAKDLRVMVERSTWLLGLSSGTGQHVSERSAQTRNLILGRPDVVSMAPE